MVSSQKVAPRHASCLSELSVRIYLNLTHPTIRGDARAIISLNCGRPNLVLEITHHVQGAGLTHNHRPSTLLPTLPVYVKLKASCKERARWSRMVACPTGFTDTVFHTPHVHSLQYLSLTHDRVKSYHCISCSQGTLPRLYLPIPPPPIEGHVFPSTHRRTGDI